MKKGKAYFELICGLLIVSIAFNFFLVPNNLAAIGVTGLSIIFKEIYNLNPFYFILIVNILLIILSYFALGKKETINTILGSILLPIFIEITAPLYLLVNMPQIDILINTIFGGILSGVGYGLIFKNGYTTGGTDILDAIVCKYFKRTMGESIIMIDGLVVLLGGLVFGLESMLYSAIVLFLISNYSNRQMIGIGADKILFIHSTQSDTIAQFLKNNFHYGLTIIEAKGGYSKKNKDVIMCSIKTAFYTLIKESILQIDPHAFLIVTDSYETRYLNKDHRHSLKKQLH